MNVKDIQPVRVSQMYHFPAGIVFEAWIRPLVIRKWLFSGPTSKIVKVDQRLEPLGRFSILELEQTNGEYIDHFGEYRLIDRPQHLIFTLSVPKHFPGETVVSIDIQSTLTGCELFLIQTGVAPEITTQSWRSMLLKLNEVLMEG